MESGEDKKGFTIRDRRVSTQTEGRQPEGPPKGEPTSTAEGAKGIRDGRDPAATELPEVSFSSFVLSLGTSALVHLGEVPDPVTRKPDKQLPLAKQTIDLLGILMEKTKGNLSADEEKMLEHLLADLRWRYVREAKKG
ncbi:MAG: DUF1844 domain-containing protein [Syntrophaceae bacterium]|nr:DUF1844 domain-containing protein [Syntrophaceae bacterium]